MNTDQQRRTSQRIFWRTVGTVGFGFSFLCFFMGTALAAIAGGSLKVMVPFWLGVFASGLALGISATRLYQEIHS